MLRFLKNLFGGRDRGSGGMGERLAADWLRRERGFSIVARNWRNPRDRREEIDLVCTDRDVMVFVEVKTRAAAALVPGYHAVDTRKKRVVRAAAKSYLRLLRPPPGTYRFDIVEVELPPNGSDVRPEIRHYENVRLF